MSNVLNAFNNTYCHIVLAPLIRGFINQGAVTVEIFLVSLICKHHHNQKGIMEIKYMLSLIYS